MATKERVSAAVGTPRTSLQALRADMHALLPKAAVVGIVVVNVSLTIALVKPPP